MYQLAQLVRVVYLTDDQALATDVISRIQDLYDSGDLRLWLTKGERYNSYWVESDMILWMSSTWLLKSVLRLRADDSATVTLDSRLMHFLETKLVYGFYEFFSPTKSPGVLAALLNLYDFASDDEIRDLAGRVISRLLGELLLFPTDQGYFFPVTASGVLLDYIQPKFSSIMWFLTEKEPVPFQPDFIGAFLATTSFSLDRVRGTWVPTLTREMLIGHPVSELKAIHGAQSMDDRILSQWSAGAFIYPDVVHDTFDMIERYELERHSFWRGYRFLFSSMFRFNLRETTELLYGFTHGTDLSGANVSVFRSGDVVLSSLERYNAHYRSRHQVVWVAGVGDVAVWTQSGVNGEGFVKDGTDSVNTHLPLIQQEENVALISYRPAKDLRENSLLSIFLPTTETRVALHFPEDRFDEVVESGRWLVGRRGDGYIGIWRHATTQTSCATSDSVACSEYFFSDPSEGLLSQVWAVVVGNKDTHGDFSNFQRVVANGTVSEQSSGIFSWLFGWGYRTELSVDGKTIISEL